MFKKVFLAATMLFSLSAHAKPLPFLPENDLWKEDNLTEQASMTEAQFNAITEGVHKFYRPLAAVHGAKLVPVNDWNDSTVNAYANQNGSDWEVHMFGGLARRKEITPDGFSMVVCHELGHHFGGFAYYGEGEWAASEGQADYFALHSCAKKIWASSAALNDAFKTKIPVSVKAKCDLSYKVVADRGICYRSAAAGQSLANLLAALGGSGVPKYDTPDKSKVSKTDVQHPQAQCRLDTYLAGMLCSVKFADSIIPARNFPQGQTSLGAEKEAYKYTCGSAQVGSRPLCWFKPKL